MDFYDIVRGLLWKTKAGSDGRHWEWHIGRGFWEIFAKLEYKARLDAWGEECRRNEMWGWRPPHPDPLRSDPATLFGIRVRFVDGYGFELARREDANKTD